MFKKGKALFEQKACSLPQLLQYRTEKYTRECGLECVCFRALRHTSATLMIVSRQDVKTSSSRLGHAQASTTKRSMSAKKRPSSQIVLNGFLERDSDFGEKEKNLENQGFSLELLGGFDPPTSSLPKSRGRFCGVPIHTE